MIYEQSSHPHCTLYFSISFLCPLRALRVFVVQSPRSFQGGTTFGGGAGSGIELQAEAVSEAGEVVEDADDVRHFEAGVVIEVEIAQGLPVRRDHPGRSRAHLLRDGAEGALAVGQIGQIAPSPLLNRFDKCRIALFDTQKLRVG